MKLTKEIVTLIGYIMVFVVGIGFIFVYSSLTDTLECDIDLYCYELGGGCGYNFTMDAFGENVSFSGVSEFDHVCINWGDI